MMTKQYILLTVFLMVGAILFAQRPKLDIKVHGGAHFQHFVYKDIQREVEQYVGWQAGFGMRLTVKRVFAELDFNFIRSHLAVFVPDSVINIGSGSGEQVAIDFQLNAFELPLKLGGLIVKKPFFKWYGHTGPSMRFNTRGIVRSQGEEFKFKPRDVNIPGVIFDWVFGTQCDVGFVNFDLTYSIGITNASKLNVRTNLHTLQLSAGILF